MLGLVAGCWFTRSVAFARVALARRTFSPHRENVRPRAKPLSRSWSCYLARMRITRITEAAYIVRQYDHVATVHLGEMSKQKLLAYLTTRHLMSSQPNEVIELEVGNEITVTFRAG